MTLTARKFVGLAEPQPWVEHALCRGMGPEPFFPETNTTVPAVPLQLCPGCPVRKECRDAGLQEHGWWGGVPERKRWRMTKDSPLPKTYRECRDAGMSIPDIIRQTGLTEHTVRRMVAKERWG